MASLRGFYCPVLPSPQRVVLDITSFDSVVREMVPSPFDEHGANLLCAEAFDCGMAAWAPETYMVAADRALAADRAMLRRDERNKVAAEVANLLRHFSGAIQGPVTLSGKARISRPSELAKIVLEWARENDSPDYVIFSKRDLLARSGLLG